MELDEQKYGDVAVMVNILFIQSMAAQVALKALFQSQPQFKGCVSEQKVDDVLMQFPLTDSQIDRVRKAAMALTR